jgi:hypothetical protein
MGAVVGALMAGNDAMLLGRHTYDEFAGFWPDADPNDPFTAQMNGARTYVVSNTLAEASWENSTKVAGDVQAELTKLKQNHSQLGTTGSGTPGPLDARARPRRRVAPARTSPRRRQRQAPLRSPERKCNSSSPRRTRSAPASFHLVYGPAAD